MGAMIRLISWGDIRLGPCASMAEKRRPPRWIDPNESMIHGFKCGKGQGKVSRSWVRVLSCKHGVGDAKWQTSSTTLSHVMTAGEWVSAVIRGNKRGQHLRRERGGSSLVGYMTWEVRIWLLCCWFVWFREWVQETRGLRLQNQHYRV